MNQGLFKLIFNRCTGMLTPTWEGASAQGKQSSTAGACALTLALLFFAHPVLANPTGGSVTNGSASFATSGNTLTITNSPNAIINWQGFSINKDEITRFIQQNGASAVLNRVTGQDPSQILGTLQSNGRVFIINPNGIVFGKGSVVDVAGLVASTLKMSDADFLSGKYKFGDGTVTGAIKNEGTINSAVGGQVYLIAPDIENNGIITSPKGEIVLAAGHSVSLVDPKNPEIVVSLTAPATKAVNVGQLISEGGSVGIYAGLIQQSGMVSANSASVDESGRVYLKGTQSVKLAANSVTSATNSAGKGGTVVVTAPEVKVETNASVDSSGQTGGGTVLIGGDAHGANPEIGNALNTTVAADATLKADAIGNGNGGKVVVWADKSTHFVGHASARGGEQGGNGGFVEVSGKGYLDFKGTVDTRAPFGKRGTLLLDPLNITIGATADINGDATTGDDISAATDLDATTKFPGADSFITASAVNALLGTTDVALAASNDINVNSGLSWSANELSLSAGRDININAVLTASGTASLTMDAGSVVFGGAVHVGLNSDGSFKGRVDFSSTGPLTINGSEYVVLNTLDEVQAINSNLTNFYALGSSIDASGKDFTPIGSDVARFSGTFDGLGHTISNLSINDPMRTRDVGLFGYIDGGGESIPGYVQNIGLLNARIAGSYNLGVLAGQNYGFISNSFATGTVTVMTDPLGGFMGTAGGLVGYNAGQVNNSYANVAVTGVAYSQNLGGLIGENSGTISNSHAAGLVSGGDSAHEIGGLVGYNAGTVSFSNASGAVKSGNCTDVESCYTRNAFGNFVGRVGGLVGLNDGSIDQSSATGKVTAGSMVAGVGGLVGENQFGSISNSNATGNVVSDVGSSFVGGLVGFNSGDISNSHYTTGAVTVKSSADFSSYSISALVGGNDYGGAISDSYTTGTVTVDGTDAYAVGGLVGYNNATISTTPGTGNTYATGAVNGGANAVAVGGLVGDNSGTIDESYATGAVSAGIGSQWMGGLVGISTRSINASYATGTVDSGMDTNSIGGLVGYLSGTVTDSFATGTVRAGSAYNVGGLVGVFFGGTISNSYATGAVSAGDGASRIGGLVGYNGATINGSYATGAVSGGAGAINLGGLVGENPGSINDSFATGSVSAGANAANLGGFVGANSGAINTSYSTGYVEAGAGSSSLGGFAGLDTSAGAYGGLITNSFWNTETSGLATSAGGTGVTGLTTAEMMTEASFVGFDFSQTWAIDPGTSFPYQQALFPNGVQVFSGTIGNYSPAVQQTEILVGGVSTSLSSVGANGFYYDFLGPNEVSTGQSYQINLVKGAQVVASYFDDASFQNSFRDFNIGELTNNSNKLNLANTTISLNLRNNGTINLDGGTIFTGFVTNNGTINANNGSTEFRGGGDFNNVTEINNGATVNLTAGTYSINNPEVFSVNGVLNNMATVNLSSSISGNGMINNNAPGVINAGRTGGLDSINPLFMNSGTLNIVGTRYTLNLNNSASNEGTVNVFETNFLSVASGYTNNGILKGKGTISLRPNQAGQIPVPGVLVNNGRIQPGASPGTLTIQGDLMLTAASTLDVELESLSSYDVLNVMGNATLAGAVNAIQFAPSFVPNVGDTFTFLNASTVNGTFATVNSPSAFGVTSSYGANFAALVASVTQVPQVDPGVLVFNPPGPGGAGTGPGGQTSVTFNALLESAPTAAIGLDGGLELYLGEPLTGENRDARLLCR